jgi:hypothetical protein
MLINTLRPTKGLSKPRLISIKYSQVKAKAIRVKRTNFFVSAAAKQRGMIAIPSRTTGTPNNQKRKNKSSRECGMNLEKSPTPNSSANAK